MAQYTLHEHDGLDTQDLAPNPLIQLQRWIEQARDAGMLEPVAACLATASTSGQPSARIVLIRQVSEQAVAFYTNHDSRKGVELADYIPGAFVVGAAGFRQCELSRRAYQELGSEVGFELGDLAADMGLGVPLDFGCSGEAARFDDRDEEFSGVPVTHCCSPLIVSME